MGSESFFQKMFEIWPSYLQILVHFHSHQELVVPADECMTLCILKGEGSFKKISHQFGTEMTMGMGFPMGMGIPWESHGNGNW